MTLPIVLILSAGRSVSSLPRERIANRPPLFTCQRVTVRAASCGHRPNWISVPVFEDLIMPNSQRDWRVDGVKVIKSDRLDSNTPQTPGMLRAAAVNAARGSRKIWAGTVIIHPNANTDAHHPAAPYTLISAMRAPA